MQSIIGMRARLVATGAVARAAQRVGLLPSDMVQGGLIDDVDVTFGNCRFMIFDYQGKSDPKLCLAVELTDDDGGIHEHYFSAANPEHFAPSDDENFIVATGEKKNLNKGSNYEAFMESLLAEGFPGPEFGKRGAESLNGLKAHVIRKPAPKRSGIINRPGQENRELTQLVISKILALPGAGKGKGGKPAPSAPAKPTKPAKQTTAAEPPAEATGADDQDTRLIEVVNAILAEQGGTVDKKTLAMQAFRKADAADKKTGPKRVVEDEFLELGEAMGQWSYDAAAGTVSAA